MISWKVQIEQYPAIGYYKICKEDNLYYCYFEKSKEFEKLFETHDEAKVFCTEKLREKLKNFKNNGIRKHFKFKVK
jgi:hypothetical protein